MQFGKKEKVAENGNNQCKYKYLKFVLKYSSECTFVAFNHWPSAD